MVVHWFWILGLKVNLLLEVVSEELIMQLPAIMGVVEDGFQKRA
jgi:hypothetical protein